MSDTFGELGSSVLVIFTLSPAIESITELIVPLKLIEIVPAGERPIDGLPTPTVVCPYRAATLR
jgi:hypothetical protein